MRHWTVTALCGATLAMTVVAGEEAMLRRFELKQPLEGAFETGERGRVIVQDDVFVEARSFPADLRIAGEDGILWPWFLYTPAADGRSEAIDCSVLNQSFITGAVPCLEFDLQIDAAAGKTPVHNQLELRTSGSDYVRRVEIYTGDDDHAGRMATGYLIDFARQKGAGNRLIRYPASDVQRLRIRIYPNARSADETFELLSADLRRIDAEPTEKHVVAAEPLVPPPREQRDDAQTFLYDLGAVGRPVEGIAFDVATPAYARGVAVYGRNTSQEPWRRIGGGQIHRFDDDVENTIRIAARHRYLKVQLFHYDDPPLDIRDIRIEAIPRYLVFEAAGTGSAALYFRAWDVQAPRHDLAQRIDAAEIGTLPVVRTLPTEPNRSAAPQSWRKYARLVAGLAVGAVSLLVIWIIVSMLKQQTPTEDS